MRWTLPNVLTVARLVAAPALPLAYVVLPRPWADLVALVLFVGAAVTDWFDGYIARKRGQVSRFGAMLDPIADKAMVVIAVAVLFGLYELDPLVVLPAAIVLFREVFVSGLREFLGSAAKTLAVTSLAKWKTTAQLVAVSVLLAQAAMEGWFNLLVETDVARGMPNAALAGGGAPGLTVTVLWLAAGLWFVGLILLWIAAALTAITGWDYFSKARPHLREPA